MTSLAVPEGMEAEAGRSLPNLIRHLGEFIRCALHRNGSPRPHPQPLPRAVYIAGKRKPFPAKRPDAEQLLRRINQNKAKCHNSNFRSLLQYQSKRPDAEQLLRRKNQNKASAPYETISNLYSLFSLTIFPPLYSRLHQELFTYNQLSQF